MRIGLDIDGVMYQWTKTARYMLREILPDSPYTKDGPMGTENTEWDYIKNNIHPAHHKWLWKEGVKLGLFRHGHLFPGTIKAVRDLSKLGDVVVVTHRPESAVQDTLDWLAYQKLPIQAVHILSQGQRKSTVGPFDYFLDDKPENCYDLGGTGATACLIDRPWNQIVDPDAMLENGVIRVKGWNEFINIIKDETSAPAERLEIPQSYPAAFRSVQVFP